MILNSDRILASMLASVATSGPMLTGCSFMSVTFVFELYLNKPVPGFWPLHLIGILLPATDKLISLGQTSSESLSESLEQLVKQLVVTALTTTPPRVLTSVVV